MTSPTRHRRLRSLVAPAALILALALAGSAYAAQVAVVPPLAAPGTEIRLEARGFAPGETITVAFGALSVGTITAGASGDVAADVEVPEALAPGLTQVVLTGSQGGSASAPFRARTNWAQLGRSAEHGFANGPENVLAPGNVAGLVRLWRVTVGEASAAVHSGPVVASGRVYVGSDDGSVRAFGSVSGRERWRRAVGAPVRTTPAAAYRRLFVTSGDRVIALDSATGEVAWKRTLGAELGSPAVDDGRVVVQDAAGMLSALDPATGADLWSARSLGTTGGRPRTPTLDDERILAVADGGASGDQLIVLDSATGDERRRVPLWPSIAAGSAANPPSFDVADPLTARAGNAVATIVAPGDVARVKSLATFSARTGDLLGTSSLDGGRIFSTSVALPGGERIGGTTEGLASLGSWSAGLPVPATPPVVAGGIVFTGGADGMHAVSAATGALLWTSAGTTRVEAPPAVADGRVYAPSADGYLDAFALASPPAPGTAAGAFTPSAATLAAAAARVSLRVTAASPQRALRTGKISVRVTCRPACRIAAGGTVLVAAHSAASSGSWARLRGVTRAARDGRAVTVRLTLSKRQRRSITKALRRSRRVQVRVDVRASAAGLKTASVARRVRVRR